ncbi:MAG: ribbon-helix-helix protein, CopG family [Acidimicrobiia bacterium]|nr:ribbon-helix-helix protein, CopG family [Acidimicrobiia bacterium]
MRTTISIDDELHRKVKAVADRTGRTIGQVIEDAIQESLRRSSSSRAIVPLPVFGREGVMPGVDLADSAGVRELMEEGVRIDARR